MLRFKLKLWVDQWTRDTDYLMIGNPRPPISAFPQSSFRQLSASLYYGHEDRRCPIRS
jgi:hypothetical protein